MLFEVRLHGRGGHGVLTGAKIIGRAAFLSGFYSQDFAMYGAERRGAPVVSFVRVDKEPILERGYVYSPEAVLIFDDTLDFKQITKGIEKNTIVLINTANPNKKFLVPSSKTYTIDATKISLNVTGKPIANTVMVGAFSKAFGSILLSKLKSAVEIELSKYSSDIIEMNKRAAEAGFNNIE